LGRWVGEQRGRWVQEQVDRGDGKKRKTKKTRKIPPLLKWK
jgi:hypothetical protein